MGTLYTWASIYSRIVSTSRHCMYSARGTTLGVLTRRLHTAIIRAAAHAISSPGDGAYGQVVAGAGLSGRACAPVKVARQGDGY